MARGRRQARVNGPIGDEELITKLSSKIFIDCYWAKVKKSPEYERIRFTNPSLIFPNGTPQVGNTPEQQQLWATLKDFIARRLRQPDHKVQKQFTTYFAHLRRQRRKWHRTHGVVMWQRTRP
jgi:hypothetical protein